MSATGRRRPKRVPLQHLQKEKYGRISYDHDHGYQQEAIAHHEVQLKCEGISHGVEIRLAFGRHLVEGKGDRRMLQLVLHLDLLHSVDEIEEIMGQQIVVDLLSRVKAHRIQASSQKLTQDHVLVQTESIIYPNG